MRLPVLAAAAASLLLSACSATGAFFGIMDPTGAPQAFPKEQGGELSELSGLYANALLVIRDLEGPPSEIAREISRRAAKEAARAEVPAIAGDGPLTADVMIGKAALDGAVMRIEWAVQRRGLEPRYFEVRVPVNAAAQAGSWPAISGAAIDIAAAETARNLAQIYGARAESNPIAAEQAALLDKAEVAVKVSGAPGDGNRLLARAMREELAARGLRPLEEPRSGAYRIDAEVAVSPDPDLPSDQVRIVWRVTGPDGLEVGKAEQANQVPKGSVDKRWGDTAFAAASAAGDDIARLILRAQALTAVP